ncbi:type IA DNA topoisomerase [Paenibacillus thermotolerans]|uniref:type IA DNA topoisomerase n=1 Tax=Paenibacillus thermotolerans TaxID=3027807 RepID=UPI002368B61B|nr:MULTISPECIES: type IA DNA topoisomerase [unclassified Paenibacillus]
MKTLVIAEKPDMGRNIAAAIEPRAVNKRTHIEGERYIITWAIGHLVTLAEPDKYDEKYKKWNMNDLPIIPEQFKLIPNYKTKDQLKTISELAKQCDALVNACDAGREGQYIFYLIQRYLKLRHPVKRLWISDLTPETIRAGFANLKDGADYDNLTKAARARSEADWLVGMNGSRAFTVKHNVLLSVGRVQTPVLALIYDRQKQIESFSSLIYYEVVGHFSQDGVLYKGLWQGERIHDKTKAETIAAKTSGQKGRVASYEVKETKEYPYKLFDLTLLQREANAKCGFSAKKTLDVAQSLYEKHKAISYPRTNSNYVTEQNIPEMHRALDALRGSAYDELVKGASKQLVHTKNFNVCNPSKVEDHHAILPTAKKPGSLTPDEAKIYDLIIRRFLSHFYPPAEYKMHTVLTEVAEETFKTTVKELLRLGWKTVYADQAKEKPKSRSKDKQNEEQEEEDETDTPFELDPQQSVVCDKAEVNEKETQPPKAYTEGTLLKAMESAGKAVEDEELRDAMKDSGLGTPATRAATIERLKQVDYIEMQGKKITITQKGRMAVELIRAAGVELLTSPEMTGHWERRLNEISKGAAEDDAFMAKVKQFAASIVDKVRSQQRADRSAFGNDGDSSPKKGARKPRSGAALRTKSAPPAAGGTIAPCPREGCGGQIFMGRKGYGCSHYKNGCGFVIWKESFGKSLTDTMIKSLIEKGKTGKLKFKAKDGSSFEAKIALTDRNTGKIELER